MHEKNTVTEALLSLFVPFYLFYWLSETSKALRQRGITHIPSFKPVLWMTILFVAAIVLAIIPMVIIPILAIGAAATSDSSGAAAAGIGITVLLTFLMMFIQFGLAVAMLIMWIVFAINFSKVVAAALPGTDAGTLTLLFIFISPAAVYMIQEAMNQPQHKPAKPSHL